MKAKKTLCMIVAGLISASTLNAGGFRISLGSTIKGKKPSKGKNSCTYRYPTGYEVFPIRDNRGNVIGSYVVPTRFKTREVGVSLNVNNVYVHSPSVKIVRSNKIPITQKQIGDVKKGLNIVIKGDVYKKVDQKDGFYHLKNLYDGKIYKLKEDR
tara:strand:+ start:578 stop:1042 length:465 start_codon:yes stop_codon:yes gene_type:complete